MSERDLVDSLRWRCESVRWQAPPCKDAECAPCRGADELERLRAERREYEALLNAVAEECWDWGYHACWEMDGKKASKSGPFLRSRAVSIKNAVKYAREHAALDADDAHREPVGRGEGE